MREQYPFFRDTDERTLAVIGEEAAVSDLDGTYQKPYAILTQKWLYCKNEGGNFITEAKNLTSAQKAQLPGQNWFLWGTAACVFLSLILLCFWYWAMGGRWKSENNHWAAQYVIDEYHAHEEKIPEYEEQIKIYKELEKVIEQSQQEFEEMDYAQIKQETDQVYREANRLKTTLDKAIKGKTAQQETVSNIERNIADYNKSITEAENKIENTDTNENNEIKSQIGTLQTTLSYWRNIKNTQDFSQYRTLVRQHWFSGKDTYVYIINGHEFLTTSAIKSYADSEITKTQRQLSTLQQKYVDIEGFKDFAAQVEGLKTEDTANA